VIDQELGLANNMAWGLDVMLCIGSLMHEDENYLHHKPARNVVLYFCQGLNKRSNRLTTTNKDITVMPVTTGQVSYANEIDEVGPTMNS
jgi:hypothetical protein